MIRTMEDRRKKNKGRKERTEGRRRRREGIIAMFLQCPKTLRVRLSA